MTQFFWGFLVRKVKHNKSSTNDKIPKRTAVSLGVAIFHFHSKQSVHQGINNVPRFSYWLFQPIDRLPLPSLDIYLTVSWLYCLWEDRKGNILTLGIESIEFSLWFIQIILQQQQRTLCFSAAAEGDRRIQLVVYTHGVCYAIITFKDNSFSASLTLSE